MSLDSEDIDWNEAPPSAQRPFPPVVSEDSSLNLLSGNESDSSGTDKPSQPREGRLHPEPGEPNPSNSRQSTWYPREPGERPNRWPLRSQKWRDQTQEVRQIAEGLAVTRARDLSIHLYNTYCLRKRLSREASAWQPRFGWAAWPMLPTEVPRPSDVTTVTFVANKSKPLRSREELEEILIGTTTLEARRRFRERQRGLNQALEQRVSILEEKERQTGRLGEGQDSSEDQNLQEDVQGIRLRSTVPEEKRVLKASTLEKSQDEHIQSDSNTSDLSESDDVSHGQDSEHSESEGPKRTRGKTNEKPPRKKRRARSFESTPSEARSSSRGSSKPLAVPTSDIDHVNRVLQPSVRNMQTRFDEVLMALHKSRLIHFKDGSAVSSRRSSRRGRRSNTQFSASASRSRSRSKFQVRGARSQSASRPDSTKDVTMNADEDDDSDKSNGSFDRAKRQAVDDDGGSSDEYLPDEGSPRARIDKERKFKSQASSTKGSSIPRAASSSRDRRHRLQERDWSHVLGMAAITGAFPSQVISRAQERCMALFDEHMDFEMLTQQNTVGKETVPFNEVLDGAHRDGFPVPVFIAQRLRGGRSERMHGV